MEMQISSHRGHIFLSEAASIYISEIAQETSTVPRCHILHQTFAALSSPTKTKIRYLLICS